MDQFEIDEKKATEQEEIRPRPYQNFLCEKAARENCIVYLPTGTGKTFIAALLIKRLSAPLNTPYSRGGKQTVFIVNTLPLVTQQTAFLAKHTGLRCKGYSGDKKAVYWSNERWKAEIEQNQVLIMIAQIFVDLLHHGTIDLKRVNLLIFDECHHAVKNHPMKLIMQQVKNHSKSEQPRILAMSASLLNSNIKSKEILPTLKQLEITYCGKIITVDDANSLTDYSTNPKEILQRYDRFARCSVVDQIFAVINESIEAIQKVHCPNTTDHPETSRVFQADSKNNKLCRILNDVQEHFEEMGLYGGYLSAIFHADQVRMLKNTADHPALTYIFDYLITKFLLIKRIIENKSGHLENLSVSLDFLRRYSTPKVVELAKLLKDFHDKDRKFSCIIFVQRRFTAKVLCHIIKKLSEIITFRFLKADYVIGNSGDPYKSARETSLSMSRHSKEVLARFRSGLLNCIVATNVLDEGVDIPACSLVVAYQAPMDFRAYIQSKGRARHRSSRYVLLVPDEAYISRYEDFQKSESCLKNLHGSTEERREPTQKEIEESMKDLEIEPFVVTKSDGSVSCVTDCSAISLIYRYCTCLNKTEKLAPAWIKKEIDEKTNAYTPTEKFFQVHLKLPPPSPMRKTIVSDKFRTLKAAKRSAALKACVELYRMKELNENFLPVRR